MRTVRVGEIARIRRGASPRPIADSRWFSDAGPGWVRIGDATRGGKYLRSTEQKLSVEGAAKSVRVKPGDVIMSVAASVGITAVVDMDACIHDGWVVLTDFEEHADREFLYYLLSHHAPYMAAVGQTGSQNNINSDILRDWKVELPPLPVQRRLSKLLSHVDRLVNTLHEILASKELLRRALRHELLTGRRRFQKFVGSEWTTSPLSRLFTERNQAGGEGDRLLSVTGDRGVIPRDELDRRDTSSSDKSKYKFVHIGDIAYNTMRMWQGVSGIARHAGIVSPAYTVLVASGLLLPEYAKHLFKHPQLVHTFWRFSQGLVDDTLSLKYPNFARISVTYPTSLEEQDRIARVLDLVDREIVLLEQLGATYESKKRALLHRLLSGDLPLPTPAVPPELAHA